MLLTVRECPIGLYVLYTTVVKEHIQAVKDSHHLCILVEGAFSDKIQRRLASTVPPRPIVKLGFDDSCAQLRQIMEDNLVATKIVEHFPTPKELRVSDHFAREASRRS